MGSSLVLFSAIALGGITLLAITNVCLLPTVPTWYSGWTLFQLVMTAFVVGTPLTLLLINLQGGWQQATRIQATEVFVIVVTLAGSALFIYTLNQIANPVVINYHPALLAVRFILLTFALSVLILMISQNSTKSMLRPAISFVIVLTSELCG